MTASTDWSPDGCAFHKRCPHATERCAKEVPALRQVSPGPAERFAAGPIGGVQLAGEAPAPASGSSRQLGVQAVQARRAPVAAATVADLVHRCRDRPWRGAWRHPLRGDPG